MRRRSVSGVAAALASVVAALGATGQAGAATCAQQVIADWGDGHFDGTHTPACIRAAIEHLPEDLQIYSSAEEDLTRLLNQRLARRYGVAAATATRVADSGSKFPLLPVVAPVAAAALAAAGALALRRRSARRGS